MIVYLDGKYNEKKLTHISPDDRGFLLSDGLYEVVRYYNGKPFRLIEHQHRMENGSKKLRFSRNSFEEFAEVASNLQAKNNLEKVESSIVYFQATRGVAPRSHGFPPEQTPLTIYAFAKEFKSNLEEQQNGANSITINDDRWANCDIKSIALLPNTLAHQTARDNDAIEGFFIRNGMVQEGTHSNICIFNDNKVITPPLSKTILAGITRKAVLELCAELSIPVHEEQIRKEELYKAKEVFIVGTTVEITPIIRVDDVKIGNSQPGKICKQLQKAFWKLVRK